MIINKEIVEFEWDKGNIGKNKKHNVDDSESEEVFFDEKKVILNEVLHVRSEEREFWNKLNLSECFSHADFERVSFPNLKPTTKPISIRIPEYLLNRIKEKANELNIPYQSLIKEYIKKGILPST